MLEKEDYLEPVCPLCPPPAEGMPLRAVPRDRILDKMREYEDRSDWAGAERHLKYWLAEAEDGRDLRGQLMLHNELMGFYRKQGKREDALSHCEAALSLIGETGMERTVTAGTTWVNAGTVREAFGDPEGALACFEKARRSYEQSLKPEDPRLGGLYNNMGLALTSAGRYGEARELFHRALDVMARQENGQPEQAITWLNLADCLSAALPPEEAERETDRCLSRAEELLSSGEIPRDGYFAFVCEKCAPVFGHYGWFMTEAELTRRVREIRDARR